ncbi:rhomboid family intramembrane serine protease [Thermodesulfobacteriota bacterium]
MVEEGDQERAVRVVEQYLRENPSFIAAGRGFPGVRTYSGIYAALFLLVVYAAIAFEDEGLFFARQYGASASRIVTGELWRAVTALALHVDVVHVAGNMVGIALFGTAVCHMAGYGVGWAMIVASGFAGNLCNAFLYRSDHVSVGASTAVFGAIGILGGYRAWQGRRGRLRGLRAWVPVAGGMALLGVLGSGARSDLTAHLFGWLVGMAVGVGYGILERPPLSARYQAASVCVVIAVLFLAFASPFLSA